MTTDLPYLGFGVRLRTEYIPEILQKSPAIDWYEVIVESYMDSDASSLNALREVRESYPLVLHSLSLDLGSPWPLDKNYLQQLKSLIETISPVWVSDHLCWSGADDTQGQLLPIPYTQDTLEHIVERIKQVQDELGMQLLLENVPASLESISDIPEEVFIKEVAEQSDSLILIDISNLHQSSINRGMDTDEYLNTLPAERVKQIHLAGASVLCEEESNPRTDLIWSLYTSAIDRFGKVSTMIEREDTIPCFDALAKEVEKARTAIDTQYLP